MSYEDMLQKTREKKDSLADAENFGGAKDKAAFVILEGFVDSIAEVGLAGFGGTLPTWDTALSSEQLTEEFRSWFHQLNDRVRDEAGKLGRAAARAHQGEFGT